jgi:DNA modification methylase
VLLAPGAPESGVRLPGQIERWPLHRVIPYPGNPRLHTAEEVRKLAAGIVALGFNKPIEVDEDGVILAGHRRLAAARYLELPEVPILQHSHLSDAEKRAYRIADNRLTLEGEWDDGLLAAEFEQIATAGLDVGLTGFAEDELAEILASVAGPEGEAELPVPDPPEVPISRPGDLWHLGDHRLLCGDATKPEHLECLLEGAQADAVWTDPPYNVAYEGSAGSIKNDALSDAEFAAFLGAAFGALISVMRPGAPIYVAHSDTGGYTFRRCFLEAGFKLSSCLIWRKNALVLSRGDYHWQHEPILYGWKPGEAHRWYGSRDKTTIVEFAAPPFQQVGEDQWQIVLGETTLIVRGHDLTIEPARSTVFLENKPTASAEHPTMKPVALVARMLANSAMRGAVVLDPFGGSGSTLMACHWLGMKARLLELDPRFVDVTVWRWAEATGGIPTLAGGEPYAAVARSRGWEPPVTAAGSRDDGR